MFKFNPLVCILAFVITVTVSACNKDDDNNTDKDWAAEAAGSYKDDLVTKTLTNGNITSDNDIIFTVSKAGTNEITISGTFFSTASSVNITFKNTTDDGTSTFNVSNGTGNFLNVDGNYVNSLGLYVTSYDVDSNEYLFSGSKQ